MSTSSNEAMQQVNRVSRRAGSFPGWVDCFLKNKFFDKCSIHNLQKNDLNRYCITCNASTCRYCVATSHHNDHKILTIYRHVYQDVVPLSEMENHIDCAKIQPYKCNKKWVVSLTPLPHNGSGSLIEGDGACNVCKRKLTDPDRFRFCSIACKVQAISGKRSLIRRPEPEVGTSERRERGEQAENQRGRKRSRKGVPHRAPLF
ncbi:uncharacterized protein LOC105157093 [Sesamum indicum]|uniref:Uncharacterized protein LOC105157093 n=1 Tax=Sesamum indicum TaxID=4182 RepID=A0A6I9SPR3_SESIN|nr:uncharacterized protein LOC105157093 [Sesamum indicum]